MAYKGKLWYIWKDLTEPLDGSTPIQHYPSILKQKVMGYIEQLQSKLKIGKQEENESKMMEIVDDDLHFEVSALEPTPIVEADLPFYRRNDNPYTVSRKRLSSYEDREAMFKKLNNHKQSYVLTYKEE